jgi:hypothetical protein
MTDDQTKEAVKEAIKEWMDDKFSTFGKWTITTAGVVLFGWVIYGLLVLNGWHR